MLLAACGGGEEKPRVSNTPNTEKLFEAPKARYPVAKFIYVPPKWAAPAQEAMKAPGPATSEDPAFRIEDEHGDTPQSLDLHPVRGRGYPELRIVLMARRIGDPAPASPVRPDCKARCEYQLSKRYAVTLSDEKFATLVPRGDGLALVAKQLSVDVPQAVEILYSVDGKVFSRKKVILLDMA